MSRKKSVLLFNLNRISSVFVMQTKVLVAGVGMTPFVKPGKGGEDYPDFAALSMERALGDAVIFKAYFADTYTVTQLVVNELYIV